jgi:broad specificity phosphatase PhoE
MYRDRSRSKIFCFEGKIQYFYRTRLRSFTSVNLRTLLVLKFLLVIVMAHVLLLRHSHRLDFIQPQWFETATYPYDPPLSAWGWQQILELTPQLLHLPIDQLYSSPYLRALQTAYPLSRAWNLKICIENGLREWLHPEWSPSLPATLPLADKMAQVPGIDVNYRASLDPLYPELIAALEHRATQVAERLVVNASGCIAIVTHRHTMSSILAALMGDQKIMPELLPATGIFLQSEARSLGSWQISQVFRPVHQPEN